MNEMRTFGFAGMQHAICPGLLTTNTPSRTA